MRRGSAQYLDIGRRIIITPFSATGTLAGKCPRRKEQLQPVRNSATSTTRKEWGVKVGDRANAIDNPIRKIMDTIAGKENPRKRVISLAQGDPTIFPHLNPSDMATSAVVSAVTSRSANGYQPSHGAHKCRVAIAEKFSVEGRPPIKENDIFMTLGCSEALNHCVAVLGSKGSNMLLPRPGFPLCQILCEYHGVEPRYYDLVPDKGWTIDIESFKALADENTCALLVNNPSNPCGSVFSREHLEDVMKAAEELKLPVVADEVYAEMSFSKPFVSCAAASSKVPVLSTCALSKRWLAPGWRIGWVAVHDVDDIFKNAGITDALLKVCQISLGPAAPFQAAIPGILHSSMMEKAWIAGVLDTIQQSAAYCVKRCEIVPGLEVVGEPEGAMYLMIKLNAGILHEIDDTVTFARKLLQEQSVVVLPGECFFFPGFFRMFVCAPIPTLEVAWDRIESFCYGHEITDDD